MNTGSGDPELFLDEPPHGSRTSTPWSISLQLQCEPLHVQLGVSSAIPGNLHGSNVSIGLSNEPPWLQGSLLWLLGKSPLCAVLKDEFTLLQVEPALLQVELALLQVEPALLQVEPALLQGEHQLPLGEPIMLSF